MVSIWYQIFIISIYILIVHTIKNIINFNILFQIELLLKGDKVLAFAFEFYLSFDTLYQDTKLSTNYQLTYTIGNSYSVVEFNTEIEKISS